MSRQEKNKKESRMNNQSEIIILVAGPKPKYNWRKHVKPKTAPQNNITSVIIEREINATNNILLNIVDLCPNDIIYQLEMLNRRLQSHLK